MNDKNIVILLTLIWWSFFILVIAISFIFKDHILILKLSFIWLIISVFKQYFEWKLKKNKL